ncbi:para-aminobenzoate synthetase component 2 [Microbacterium sp. AG1240]|uniref:anthranilate synthase component II n=1 Tax=Microbacterium sp. AG1240 TaxID=2183992 RepID=UPI000EABF96A|nr:aminodeoxychorismate/anthranilate synthase component II [Microbacterium sp. AG1240]RKT31608.1 para-aminobenzoate synthetase component 2 [Microbacterium sp. AG1240]
MSALRVLVVDNHDSFVHTLVDYLAELGAIVTMVEADAIDPSVELAHHDAVLVSPGPGDPADAGASIAVVTEAAERGLPLLGVCLGHQAIGAAYGARVVHAPELMHGMTSDVRHDDSILFAGLPDPFTATRYHSLAVDEASLPSEIVVTARTGSGVVMALAHRSLPMWGVQFHPESILTEGGHRLLGNWLEAAGSVEAAERGRMLRPRRSDSAQRDVSRSS